MEEILTKLYSYKYFGSFLIIAIIALILLFLIILFFGKKDQKKREIEATKKLMQINEDTLNDQFVLEETPKTEEEHLENDTIIMPSINNIEEDNNVVVDNSIKEEISEPILPTNEEVSSPNNLVDDTPIINLNEQESFKVEENSEVVEVPKIEYPEFTTVDISSEPVLHKEEEKPFVFNDIQEVKTEVKPIPKKEEVSVPEFNYEEIMRLAEEVKKDENIELPKMEKGPEIFSSVYAPEKKEEVATDNNKEEDFELPTLKKDVQEEKIEVPKLNDFNLDEISGESYNIK